MMDEDNSDDANDVIVNNEEENGIQIDDLAKQEAAELDEARKEKLELIAAEQKKLSNVMPNQGTATKEEKLNYLLSQSEVFAHFLAGRAYDIFMIFC
jgi:hypothetical protein